MRAPETKSPAPSGVYGDTQEPVYHDIHHDGPRHPVSIRIPHGLLPGQLTLPERAQRIVIFAPGSGASAAAGPRNRYLADQLAGHGIGSLVFDPLTMYESEDPAHVFDIHLLAHRLVTGTDWVSGQRDIAQLPVGYFGASSGAAAALIASTMCSRRIAAVVSRSGRPDLASSVLQKVTSPTLLLVGENDTGALQLNRLALARLPGVKKLEIIPGATRLFTEPGALESVAQHAARWFARYFALALHPG